MSKLAVGLLGTSVNKKYRDQIIACRETWIPECEKLGVQVRIFGGNIVHSDTPLIHLDGIGDDYASASYKQFLGLKYMYENIPADFYFFAGTDNYIVPQRMLNFLQNHDSKELLYIGGHGWNRDINGKSIYFHSGGAGFILSSGLMKVLYDKNFLSFDSIALWRNICQGNLQYLRDACDVAIAYILDKYIPNFKIIFDNKFFGCSCYGRNHNDINPCCLGDKFPNWETCMALHYMEPSTIKEFHMYITDSKLQDVDPLWTFVTSISKDISDINTQCWFVLGLRVNLVIFCDDDQVETIKNIRSKHNLLNYTNIIPKSKYEDNINSFFQLTKYLDKIQNGRINYNKNPSKSTSAEYAINSCIKFGMLKIAITNNKIFSNHYYAWINSNIQCSTGPHAPQIHRIINLYKDKCKFCYIDHTKKDIVLNLDEYYSHGRCGVACNFFTGSSLYMNKLCDLFQNEFCKIVEAGYLHAEEQLIPQIYYNNPDIFEFYYGDYFTVLANYDHIRIGPGSVLNYFINNTRINGEYNLCVDAGLKLFNDLNEDFCILSIKEKLNLLDNLFLATFNLGKYEQCISLLDKFNEFDELLTSEIINHTDLIMDYLRINTDKQYALVNKVNNKHKEQVKDILEDPMIKFLKNNYIVILFTDIRIGNHSLCNNDIIIRPSSMKNNIKDNLYKVIITIK